jgi:hypothetical protein
VKILEGGNGGIDIVRTSSGFNRQSDLPPRPRPRRERDNDKRKREKKGVGSTLAGVLEPFVDRLSC